MRTIITQITLCADDDNPVIGDTAIHIGMEDQGAGPYLTVSTPDPGIPVCIDPDEWHAFVAACEMMQGEIKKIKAGNYD